MVHLGLPLLAMQGKAAIAVPLRATGRLWLLWGLMAVAMVEEEDKAGSATATFLVTVLVAVLIGPLTGAASIAVVLPTGSAAMLHLPTWLPPLGLHPLLQLLPLLPQCSPHAQLQCSNSPCGCHCFSVPTHHLPTPPLHVAATAKYTHAPAATAAAATIVVVLATMNALTCCGDGTEHK